MNYNLRFPHFYQAWLYLNFALDSLCQKVPIARCEYLPKHHTTRSFATNPPTTTFVRAIDTGYQYSNQTREVKPIQLLT
jgi:hypothetical protein